MVTPDASGEKTSHRPEARFPGLFCAFKAECCDFPKTVCCSLKVMKNLHKLTRKNSEKKLINTRKS